MKLRKIRHIDKKYLTDFSVMGGTKSIDLYVDYIAQKVDELIDVVNTLVDKIQRL